MDLRRSCTFSKLEKVRNEEIRRKIKTERKVREGINKLRLIIIVWACRKDGRSWRQEEKLQNGNHAHEEKEEDHRKRLVETSPNYDRRKWIRK